MTTTQKTIITLSILGATALGANSALAFGGHGMGGPHHSDRDSLIPTELREEFRIEKRALLEEMTDEERAEFREEMIENRRGHRGEKREAFALFTGLSIDELKEAKQNGQSIGDVLLGQGITQADAEVFLTEQANDRIDHMTERFDLSDEDEQTLRGRIAEFVQNKLAKWFTLAQ